MRAPRSLFLIAGAAVIIAIALAALWRPRPARRVYALVPAAAGVREGTLVLYRGIEVGRVGRITFEPGGVRLALELSRADVPLRAVDTVRFSTLGLLGDKVVDIRAGPADAPPVPEGGTLRTVAPASELDPNRLWEAITRGALPPDSARRDTARATGSRP